MALGILKNEDNVAETVFQHGFARGFHGGIGANLIGEFGIESGREGIGQFDEVAIGALRDVAGIKKIGEHGEQDQDDGDDRGVPKREADAHGIKHAISSNCLEWLYRRSSAMAAQQPPRERQGRSRCRAASAKEASRCLRRFCGAGGSRRPR